MSSERRAHSRHNVRILVQHHERADAPYEVDYASDLSSGGLFITSRSVAPLGSTIHVQFSPAKDARMVEAFCRVARVTPTGVGAQFVQMDPTSAQLLGSVLGKVELRANA